MLPITDSRTLARLFHLNSAPWLNIDAYASESYGVRHKHVGDAAAGISLPTLAPPEGLRSLLGRRESCRNYYEKPLSVAVLGEMIGGAFGFTRRLRVPGGIEIQTRAAPSAGALYPLELYVVCHRVTEVADGLYHYGAPEHSLEPVPQGQPADALPAILLAEAFVQNANALVFMTAVFDRTQHKYGPRGYRYILLEAGHVAQNLCLLAAERELGSLCIGGFMDHATNRFLGVDGLEEAAIYAVAIGHPSEAATVSE